MSGGPPGMGGPGGSRMSSAAGMAVALLLAIVLPFIFVQVILAGLAALHLTPAAAIAVALAMLFGGLVNIPLYRVRRDFAVIDNPLDVFGVGSLWRSFARRRQETIIAVNVGGCLVPTGLALYQIGHLVPAGGGVLIALCIAVALNVGVCFAFARPIPQVGIVMPIGIPAGAAVLAALALAPGHAAPVAFVAGVLGPLIGADLLNLPTIHRTTTGIASIGGAGTYDGIVLSGFLAAYLA